MHQDATSVPPTDHPLVAAPVEPDGLPRRSVVLLGAAASLGAVTVAGCGSSSSGAASANSPSTSSPATGSAESSSPATGSSATGQVLAKLADVPVGGSYAATGPNGKPIVLAQPSAGRVVAFSALCTHFGCKVNPSGATLVCPCHQSTFNAFTGQNLSGPAPTPLPAVKVKVSGSNVVAD